MPADDRARTWRFQRLAATDRARKDLAARARANFAPFRALRSQARVAVSQYQPLDELLLIPRVRVLRGLARFDWATQSELFHALSVCEDHTSQEHQNCSQALVRITALGLAEHRGRRGARDYRITQAGRDECARIAELMRVADAETRRRTA